ncbi:MAG: DNA polymerase III subunit gamma/tau, partial [Parcubacteria group bacterium]|nr:DNA polymerase III subunit gamma/tau [Parcubacteria group bacterium]
NDGNCFDVIEIDAASNRGVDDARDLRERTRFAPSSAAYKIFILDEAHMLTPEAFNALLKTLEEPPSYIIFILATTELHKVPDTIVSRCQQFDFKKVSIDGLVHLLKTIARKEGAQVEDAVLNAIARNASGSARDAESILSQILSLGEKKITMEIASIVLPHSGEEEVYAFIESLVHKKTKEAIEYINKIFFEGIDLGQFTLDCIEMTRTILLIKTGVGTENMFSPHIKNKLVEISKQIEYDSLLALLNELMHTQSSEYALIPQLPLEAMIVKVCQISDLGSQLSDI